MIIEMQTDNTLNLIVLFTNEEGSEQEGGYGSYRICHSLAAYVLREIILDVLTTVETELSTDGLPDMGAARNQIVELLESKEGIHECKENLERTEMFTCEIYPSEKR